MYLIGEMAEARRCCSCGGMGRQEKWRDHQNPPTENEPVPPYCSVFLSIRSISGHSTAVLSSWIRASSGSNLWEGKPPLSDHHTQNHSTPSLTPSTTTPNPNNLHSVTTAESQHTPTKHPPTLPQQENPRHSVNDHYNDRCI